MNYSHDISYGYDQLQPISTLDSYDNPYLDAPAINKDRQYSTTAEFPIIKTAIPLPPYATPVNHQRTASNAYNMSINDNNMILLFIFILIMVTVLNSMKMRKMAKKIKKLKKLGD